jgi:CBS domain-containing protein
MSADIGSICRRRIVSVDAAASWVEAATLMREHHVGALVVTQRTDEGLRVNGIVTDRDLVVDGMARGLDPSASAIGELASQRIASVSEDDDLSDALAVMQDGGVRRLLVTDAEQQLVGIVSLDDLMHACAAQMEGMAKVIRSGIEREIAQTPAATPEPIVLRIPAMGTAGWGQPIA